VEEVKFNPGFLVLVPLAKKYPDQTIPLFQKAIEDESHTVKNLATLALMDIANTHPNEVVFLLQEAMQNERESVRKSAESMLENVRKMIE